MYNLDFSKKLKKELRRMEESTDMEDFRTDAESFKKGAHWAFELIKSKSKK